MRLIRKKTYLQLKLHIHALENTVSRQAQVIAELKNALTREKAETKRLRRTIQDLRRGD